jgi:general secretion pathway protein H
MTPTSAIGADRPAASSEGGFSLIELMLVMAIIALAASAVLLAAPPSTPSLPAEAERLAMRLERAQQAAIVENRAYAAEIDRAGYTFAVRREGQWLPLSRPPFAAAAWEAGTRAALPEQGRVRLVFDPVGAADPFELRLGRDGVQRRIRVDAAGEVWVDDNVLAPAR